MNLQATFDKVLNKISWQGAPSLDDRDSCAYRDNEGRGCAIGVLLSNRAIKLLDDMKLMDSNLEQILEIPEVYRELEIADYNPNRVTKIWGDVDVSEQEFFKELQCCHDFADRNRFVPDFTMKMQKLAARMGLSYREPKL